jgi:hypothetical protein
VPSTSSSAVMRATRARRRRGSGSSSARASPALRPAGSSTSDRAAPRRRPRRAPPAPRRVETFWPGTYGTTTPPPPRASAAERGRVASAPSATAITAPSPTGQRRAHGGLEVRRARVGPRWACRRRGRACAARAAEADPPRARGADRGAEIAAAVGLDPPRKRSTSRPPPAPGASARTRAGRGARRPSARHTSSHASTTNESRRSISRTIVEARRLARAKRSPNIERLVSTTMACTAPSASCQRGSLGRTDRHVGRAVAQAMAAAEPRRRASRRRVSALAPAAAAARTVAGSDDDRGDAHVE